MPITPFKKIYTEDQQLTDVQGNIESTVRGVILCPLLDGVLLQGVPLIAGQPNVVSHQLQRSFRGFIVVDNLANTNIWRQVDTTPGLTLTLLCSVSTTVSLYVF